MRFAILFLCFIFFQQCNPTNEKINMKNSGETEKWKIVETYSAIFLNSDAHQWNKVRASFSDTVNLDYTSLSGQPATAMKSDDIIKAWSSFLPKFNFTLHYLTNHVVSIEENEAIASCYVHAVHHLKGAEGGDFWEVYGTYDIKLQKTNDEWKVTALKYNHKYAEGNLKLPEIASKQ
jgi:hypothetical protein